MRAIIRGLGRRRHRDVQRVARLDQGGDQARRGARPGADRAAPRGPRAGAPASCATPGPSWTASRTSPTTCGRRRAELEDLLSARDLLQGAAGDRPARDGHRDGVRRAPRRRARRAGRGLHRGALQRLRQDAGLGGLDEDAAGADRSTAARAARPRTARSGSDRQLLRPSVDACAGRLPAADRRCARSHRRRAARQPSSLAPLLRRRHRDRGAARAGPRRHPRGVRAAHRRRQEDRRAVGRPRVDQGRHATPSSARPREPASCSRTSSPRSSRAPSTSCRTAAMAAQGGPHLTPRQAFEREGSSPRSSTSARPGMSAADAVADYLRDAAFTTLNRFVALKMLEARELVQECITEGEQSAGYREFCGMAPGLALLPDGAGYRLYLESLFDELSTEVKVLFDRRDPAAVALAAARRRSRSCSRSSTPRSSTASGPRTRRSAGSTSSSTAPTSARRCATRARRRATAASWPSATSSSRRATSSSSSSTTRSAAPGWRCTATRRGSLESLRVPRAARSTSRSAPRPRKDPRDLRILDPACGSGHFLLYAFDLLLAIYEEAWAAGDAAPPSDADGPDAPRGLPDLDELREAAPGADRRAQPPRRGHRRPLRADRGPALWLRAQRAYQDLGHPRPTRGRASSARTSSSPSRCPATGSSRRRSPASSSKPFQRRCSPG